MRPSPLAIPLERRAPSMHRLFRYPAKFHPPVVDALIEAFTKPGQVIFDPFCGSGTTLLESSIAGRRSSGSDIDPLAVAIATAKTRRYELEEVRETLGQINAAASDFERAEADYRQLQWEDLTESQMESELGDLQLPAIPNFKHWFRNNVAVDLARLKRVIASTEASESVLALAYILFASIIRNSSNADPVPVSGLEVTAHMRRLDAEGRIINPFALFRRATQKALAAVAEVNALVDKETPSPAVSLADATTSRPPEQVDAVITSPPYHNAVDYYRRHQLEMFWLDLTPSQTERLALKPRYIGAPRTPAAHPALSLAWSPTTAAAQWERAMAAENEQRARDFRAYMSMMNQVFMNLGAVLEPGSPLVFVVGRSTWNGDAIPTDSLFVELSDSLFSLDQHLTYPVRNRYMSYSRRNGADINEEHVLVLRRR